MIDQETLDKIELCYDLRCDRGRTLEVIDGVISDHLVDCPVCQGRGFKEKDDRSN